MVKICQTGLLKLNFEIKPKTRIFRFLPKTSAGHGWSWTFFCQFPNPWSGMGCYTSKCEKSQKHCTVMSYLWFFFTSFSETAVASTQFKWNDGTQPLYKAFAEDVTFNPEYVDCIWHMPCRPDETCSPNSAESHRCVNLLKLKFYLHS